MLFPIRESEHRAQQNQTIPAPVVHRLSTQFQYRYTGSTGNSIPILVAIIILSQGLHRRSLPCVVMIFTEPRQTVQLPMTSHAITRLWAATDGDDRTQYAFDINQTSRKFFSLYPAISSPHISRCLAARLVLVLPTIPHLTLHTQTTHTHKDCQLTYYTFTFHLYNT